MLFSFFNPFSLLIPVSSKPFAASVNRADILLLLWKLVLLHPQTIVKGTPKTMSQELKQAATQTAVQVQGHRLTQQQMLQVRLLEMPLTELEENVSAEIYDNPALEVGREHEEDGPAPMADADESFDEQRDREDRQDALDAALERIGGDDSDLPVYDPHTLPTDTADYEGVVYGDPVSFVDKLREQMGERELSDQQTQILEYLIGSLDDDGLLRMPLDTIADKLAIYHNLDVEEKNVEEMLHVLQDFDPPGIGARSLQECLLLQVHRKQRDLRPVNTEAKKMMAQRYNLVYTIISDYWDAFAKKRWDKLRQQLKLSDHQVTELQQEVRRLNPKPGASMGETMGRNVDQVTPDFIVETGDDGSVSFTLNHGNLPELRVSPQYEEMVRAYRDNKAGMNRREKEALLYAREKVARAQGYIEAVRQRRHTLCVTMKAIISLQHKFFVDGDEADLRPMALKDVADRTGLDISTISRVSNIKYAQTRWGTFPLRFFFTDGYTTESGEELSTRNVKLALKAVIDQEDKQHPLSDDALAKAMAVKGLPIARRTVAKYREQMGLPVARLRKE